MEDANYTFKDDFRSAYYGWNAVYGTMTCVFTSLFVTCERN